RTSTCVVTSVIGRTTRIPRLASSVLRTSRNRAGARYGDGYTNDSRQCLDAPEIVSRVSSAVTTGTPRVPSDRVAARALRWFASRIRTGPITHAPPARDEMPPAGYWR